MNILVSIPESVVKKTFIPADVRAEIESLGHVIWNTSEKQFTNDEFKEKIKNAEVCITGWGTALLGEYILKNALQLKLVAHTGGSVADVASEYLYRKGVKVISGNRLYAESVAEGVIAYMLCSLRDIPYFMNIVNSGNWRAEEFRQEGLLDQTVGLIGFGMVAKHLVQMLKPFRNKIKVYCPYSSDDTFKAFGVERATMEDIFSTCKIISIHASLTEKTYHMVNKELLEIMTNSCLSTCF